MNRLVLEEKFNRAQKIYRDALATPISELNTEDHRKQWNETIENKLKEAERLFLEILRTGINVVTRIHCYNELCLIYSTNDRRKQLYYLNKLKKILPTIPKNKLPVEFFNWQHHILLDIGDCYFELKEYKKAEKFYKTLKGFDDIMFYWRMGCLRLVKGDFYNAFILWSKFILVSKNKLGTKYHKWPLLKIRNGINKYIKEENNANRKNNHPKI